jgi:hypothetical protein
MVAREGKDGRPHTTLAVFTRASPPPPTPLPSSRRTWFLVGLAPRSRRSSASSASPRATATSSADRPVGSMTLTSAEAWIKAIATGTDRSAASTSIGEPSPLITSTSAPICHGEGGSWVKTLEGD